MRSDARLALVAAFVLAGCAQIVGADFDVVPATGGAGGTGGTVVSAASDSSASTGGAGPIELATDEDPYDVAVDDTYVYWTSSDGANGGAVRRVKKDGTGLQTLADQQLLANRLALTATDVYWTDSGSDASVKDGALRRVPKSGGNVETLAPGLAYPIGFAVDDNDVYVTTREPTPDPNTHHVYHFTLSPLTTPADFVHAPDVPSMLVVQGGRLWGTSFGAGLVWRVDLDGTNLTVEHAIANANAIVAVADGVIADGYANPGDVDYLAPNGGFVGLSSTEANPAALATDGGWVYWADFSSGDLKRVPLSGGTIETVQAGIPSANGVAVDADFVYVTQHQPGGKILKIPKP